jgi:hypothetical protein
MAALDTLKTEVTEATTVMQSAATLIQGLKSKLDEAIEKLNQGDNGAALEELSASLDTSSNDLAAAISANTPAEPPAPAPAPEPAPAPAPTEPPVAG